MLPIRSLRRLFQPVELLACRNAHTVSSAVKKLSCRGWKPLRMTTGAPSIFTSAPYVPGPSRFTSALANSRPSAYGLTSG